MSEEQMARFGSPEPKASMRRRQRTGYKFTFAFGATPFPAIMPIGPHVRDAGARPKDPAKRLQPA